MTTSPRCCAAVSRAPPPISTPDRTSSTSSAAGTPGHVGAALPSEWRSPPPPPAPCPRARAGGARRPPPPGGGGGPARPPRGGLRARLGRPRPPEPQPKPHRRCRPAAVHTCDESLGTEDDAGQVGTDEVGQLPGGPQQPQHPSELPGERDRPGQQVGDPGGQRILHERTMRVRRPPPGGD